MLSWQADAAELRLKRRTLLKVGSLAGCGISLAGYLRARAWGAAAPSRDTAVIHVYMGGGPSHIDLFDMKPEAPAEIRGEFRPIATSLPGVQICEHLPHLTRALEHVAIVRSVAHAEPGHLPATHWMVTGHRPPPATTSNKNPYCGAVVSKLRGANAAGMPAYVSIPRRQLLGAASYLGSEHNPFTPESDPNSPTFAVRNLHFPDGLDAARLGDRRQLLRDLDRLQSDAQTFGELAGLDRFSREAIDLVTSSRAQEAFNLEREPAATRDRYGRTSAGQSCLLARRLVEAGVTFVTVLSGGEWDTHTNNFATLKNVSLPLVDQALASLISDIHERGLDRRVLVLINGEFGRTPKINPQAGRDHWPGAMSVLFAGGGLRVGQVIGATDDHAMHPTTRPYSPGDVLATVYRHLGINTEHLFHDRSNRPLPVLQEGKAIGELVG